MAAPLRKQVIEELRDALVAFEYKPGDRLIERELVERFGVSRTVVREALRHLEAEKLIEIIPNHGPIVRGVTRSDAKALYEVREALESLAASLCASNASPEQRRELRLAFQRVEEAYDRNDLQEQMTAKDEFYALMIDTGGNPVVDSMLKTVKTRTHLLRGRSLQSPGRIADSRAELHALVEAIEQGDAEEAKHLAALHVRRAGDTAIAALDRAEGLI